MSAAPHPAAGRAPVLGLRFLGKLRRAVGRAIKTVAGRFGIGRPRT